MTPESATIDSRPEFADFARLRELFSITRTDAYRLERAGEIKFVKMRKRGNVNGKILVNCDSVRAYLKRCSESE